MQGLTDAMLDEIEKTHPEGIPSHAIVEVLDSNGVKFSEATLRKYVQLGLLPRSVRVGRKGKHRGSQGLYPASIVRQIVEIKRLLHENYTIEQIQQQYLLLRGEIEQLEQQLARLFEDIETALKSRADDTSAEHVRRDLKGARGVASELITRLAALESRLSLQARLARAAG
jgi:hypothetical protein